MRVFALKSTFGFAGKFLTGDRKTVPISRTLHTLAVSINGKTQTNNGIMFDELSKYKDNDHFFLRSNDDLKAVCNAPSKNGIFLIYSLNRGRIEMVYIGCTDVSLEMEGLKNQIVSRDEFLKRKIKEEGADALDIYWYVTNTAKKVDNPKEIELKILQRHMEIYRTMPRWNK